MNGLFWTKNAHYCIKFNYKFDDISNEIEKCSNVKAIEYNRVVESIARLGYDVYNGSTPPQQSIPSYHLAYDLGFRTMLCDLRFTSDNKPVLFHDDKINTFLVNAKKSEVYLFESHRQELENYENNLENSIPKKIKFSKNFYIFIMIYIKFYIFFQLIGIVIFLL